jgi:hypothetical protein
VIAIYNGFQEIISLKLHAINWNLKARVSSFIQKYKANELECELNFYAIESSLAMQLLKIQIIWWTVKCAFHWHNIFIIMIFSLFFRKANCHLQIISNVEILVLEATDTLKDRETLRETIRKKNLKSEIFRLWICEHQAILCTCLQG